VNITIGIFEKINLEDKKMKKSSIAKLVLFIIFLVNFSFGSTAHSLDFSINENDTYNLILHPLIGQKVKRIIIRVDNGTDKHDRKHFGINAKPGKPVTIANLKLNTGYILTLTYYTKDNKEIIDNSMLLVNVINKPGTTAYFLCWRYIAEQKNYEENPRINKSLRKIPI
jgi:hypothetical protein